MRSAHQMKKFLSDMKLASLIEVNRYLEEKGYELTADKNKNGMYRCDIYKDGQFVREAKNEYLTWEEAQEQTAIDMFNWFIKQQ